MFWPFVEREESYLKSVSVDLVKMTGSASVPGTGRCVGHKTHALKVPFGHLGKRNQDFRCEVMQGKIEIRVVRDSGRSTGMTLAVRSAGYLA